SKDFLSKRAVLSALAATLLSATAGSAFAQPLAMTEPSGFPFPASIFQQVMPPQAAPEQAVPDQDATAPAEVAPQFQRQIVAYPTREAPGTIVIDTPNTYLYYVLGGGRAVRYGIGVGRDGFTWSGT